MKRELIMAVVATAAIYHNGKHYNIGDEIELTDTELKELSIYVQPKDEAVKASLAAQQEAEATAAAFAAEAEAEKEALRQEVIRANEAHAQAEALATENGLRAEEAEAKVAELEQKLAETEAALAEAQASGAKEPKKGKGSKGEQADKTEPDAVAE